MYPVYKSSVQNLPMIHQASNSAKILTDLKKSFSESMAANNHSLIAISGGPDSTALLLALSQLPYKLSACHVNHHLRGEESNKDQAFCESLCQKLNINLVVKHAQQTSNSENSLRDERYRLLSECAQELNCSFIVTAHTLDDQSETVLFRLLRGTGPNGLRGIPHSRQISENLTVIRPLLNVSRASIQAYLTEAGISACLDSSNNESTYARNFIRHELLPIIEKRFGGSKKRLSQVAQIEQEEINYWKPIVDNCLQDLKKLALPFSLSCEEGKEKVLCWDKQKFEDLPQALKRRILHEFLTQNEIEASFSRIEKILKTIASNSSLSLNTFWQLKANSAFIVWYKTLSDKPVKHQNQSLTTKQSLPEYSLSIPGLTLLPALNKAFKVTPYKDAGSKIAFPPRHSFEAIVDLSHVKSPLTIRLRKPGDKLRPFGMTNLVKLKKYLHGLNSPLKLRSKLQPLIVVCDGEEIIWIPGLGLSNKIAVKDKPTHHLALLDLEPDTNFFA